MPYSLHEYMTLTIDHTELGSEIERLRQNLKPKVAALHHLEGIYTLHTVYKLLYKRQKI